MVQLFLICANGETSATLLQSCRQHLSGVPVTVLPDGVAALCALRSQLDLPYTPAPPVILLDICHLPIDEGIEFLRQLRQDPALKMWPVFVLGASADAHLLGAFYDFHIAAYALRTNIDEAYLYLIELLNAYLNVVELPQPLSRRLL